MTTASEPFVRVIHPSPVARARAGAALCALAAILALAGCKGGRNGGASRSEGQTRATEAAELGSRLAEQGLLDAALVEFERAIEINPTLTTAYMGAGDIHRARGDYASAESQYAIAAEIAPQEFDPQYWHGFALQMLDRLSEAVRAYLRALAIKPEDFNTNLNLATAYLQLGENEQAVVYAERAVRVNPEDGAARMNLGAAYANVGRHAEAIEQYEAATERVPEPSPEMLLNLAESQGKVGRYAEMTGTVREVIARRPSAQAYERLGSALFRSQDYAGARGAFEQAAQLDPNHYPAWNGIGVCLLNQYLWSGKTDLAALDEARNALRRSLQVRRDQPRIVELLTRY